MKLLAIDTATEACSVALYLHDKVLQRFCMAFRTHTRVLLPLIDDVLKEADLSLNEIDAFAFGRGPGSFTGTRIACSVIQALSFGLNKPVVPVSTLHALAQGALRTSLATRVFANLDARLASLYWGLFEKGAGGIMQPVSDEHLSLKEDIHLPKGEWEAITGYPQAEDIARIAIFEYQAGHAMPAALALPVYLRDEVVKKE